MTDEEYEGRNPKFREWGLVYLCPMPEDNQPVLITYRQCGELLVDVDICHIDEDYGYCLQYNENWEFVTAWMPLPEAYEEDGGDTV